MTRVGGSLFWFPCIILLRRFTPPPSHHTCPYSVVFLRNWLFSRTVPYRVCSMFRTRNLTTMCVGGAIVLLLESARALLWFSTKRNARVIRQVNIIFRIDRIISYSSKYPTGISWITYYYPFLFVFNNMQIKPSRWTR